MPERIENESTFSAPAIVCVPPSDTKSLLHQINESLAFAHLEKLHPGKSCKEVRCSQYNRSTDLA